jgi:hypothetical protein
VAFCADALNNLPHFSGGDGDLIEPNEKCGIVSPVSLISRVSCSLLKIGIEVSKKPVASANLKSPGTNGFCGYGKKERIRNKRK